MDIERTENCAIAWSLAGRFIRLTYTGHILEPDEFAAIGAHLREPLRALAGDFVLITVFTGSLGRLSEIEIRQTAALYGPLKAVGCRGLIRVIEEGCGSDVDRLDENAKRNGLPISYCVDVAEAQKRANSIFS